jgi:hypothetical protein
MPDGGGNRVFIALADQIAISNFHVIWIQHFRVFAVQAMVQNPWNIGPMDNPEDESFLQREILGHCGDSGLYIYCHRMQNAWRSNRTNACGTKKNVGPDACAPAPFRNSAA